MNIADFRKLFLSLSFDKRYDIITNRDFLSADLDIILFAFNLSDTRSKMYIINNDILCYKLIKSTL